MNAADIELARMVYLVSALGALLFTSLCLRGLWRPLRFLLLAIVFSIIATPFFADGRQDYVVPAFVVMLNDVVQHRHDANVLAYAKQAGSPIVLVMAVTSLVALLFAWLLPKPVKPRSAKRAVPDEKAPKKKNKKRNPYLPDDFQPE